MKTLLFILFTLVLAGCYQTVDSYFNVDKYKVAANSNKIIDEHNLQLIGRFSVREKNRLALTIEIHNTSNTVIDSLDFKLRTENDSSFTSFDSLIYSDLKNNPSSRNIQRSIRQRTEESNDTALTLFFHTDTNFPDSLFLTFMVVGKIDTVRFRQGGHQTFTRKTYRQPLSR
jgi:hypothetical protein